MAACKKNAVRLGAHLVFLDESGFLLIPTVRRTWSPKGQTPVLRHHQRREKVSVISALSVSPKRGRVGLHFRCHPQTNIRQEEIVDFLRLLLRHLRGFVIVIWDNGRTHKGKLVREFCRGCRRIRLEALPPYAPELNPDEGVWNQAKNKLANGRPDDAFKLLDAVTDVLTDMRKSQAALRWCFHQSTLPPFLQ